MFTIIGNVSAVEYRDGDVIVMHRRSLYNRVSCTSHRCCHMTQEITQYIDVVPSLSPRYGHDSIVEFPGINEPDYTPTVPYKAYVL